MDICLFIFKNKFADKMRFFFCNYNIFNEKMDSIQGSDCRLSLFPKSRGVLWMSVYFFYDLFFCTKFSFFLEAIKKSNFITQFSRLCLIKKKYESLRYISNTFKSNFGLLSIFLKNQKISNVSFNHLQLACWFKIYHRSDTSTDKFFLLNNYFVFVSFKLNYSTNIQFLLLNKFHNSYISHEFWHKKFLIIGSSFLEKIHMLSGANSLLRGTACLSTFNRKKYTSALLFFSIWLNLIKINYFGNKLFFKKEKKNFNMKIDPNLNFFLRCKKTKFFIFYTAVISNFKIMPSVDRIPLRFIWKICNVFNKFEKTLKKIKNSINKNLQIDLCIKLSKKKIFYIKKNSVLVQRNNYFSEKLQNKFKKKRAKKMLTFLIDKIWFFECGLFKGSENFSDEIFGIIFISQFEKLFREQYLNIWLSSFFIHLNCSTYGLISIIPNSISLHELKNKKNMGILFCVLNKKQQLKFVESLVGYSLLSFVLQLKDRHSGNILINLDEKIIHVDFGYILGHLPGNLRFEADFFKLSNEFLLKFRGKKTERFEYFKEIFLRSFRELKKNILKFELVLEITLSQNKKSDIDYKVKIFKKRLKLNLYEKRFMKYCLNMIEESAENWKTAQYDEYQRRFSKVK